MKKLNLAKFNFKKQVLFITAFFYTQFVQAQGQTTSQLQGYKSTFVTIINVVFGIGVAYGIINVVLGFFGQHKEGAMKNLMYLIIGIIIWGLFNAFFSDFGGTKQLTMP